MRVMLLSIAAMLSACAAQRPTPATRAPALQSLPATGTFAWVRPGELLADATPADDSSASTGAVRSMRLDIEALLLGQGWKAVSADTAEFTATVVTMKRLAMQTQVRPVPGTEFPRATCDLSRKSLCTATPTPAQTVRYDSVHVTVSEERTLLALRRRADDARRTFTSPHRGATESGGYFVRELITLLKSPAPGKSP